MTEEQLHGKVEELNMHIKSLESDLKDLTRQNYELMKRISELVDLLRSNNISLN